MAASFTEYVRLITEASQTLTEIGRVNNAIMKLREQASKPITVKMNFENEKIIQGEKKVRAEKQKTADVEHKNIQQRLADWKAIKAMNAEQGGLPFNVRYGSQQSLEQGRRFNEQLEESTKRINKLGDAHKHVAQVAKAASVDVSPRLAETLSNQIVNRADKAEANTIKAAARAEQELNKAKQDGIALSIKIKENNAAIEAAAGARAQIELEKAHQAGIALSIKLKENNAAIEAAAGAKAQIQIEKENAAQIKAVEKQLENDIKAQVQAEQALNRAKTAGIALSIRMKEANNTIEASAGAKAQLQMEKEIEAVERQRIRLVRERQAQEEEGARRVIAMEREKNRIASSNEGGIRGIGGELIRDTRRNLMYGGIARVEQMGASAFEATRERSQEIEKLYQAGRSAAETDEIVKNAKTMSQQFPMVTQTEGIAVQRHAIGEVADVKQGEELAKLAVPFVALRTSAVGMEAALSENQKIMKGFNELNWTKHPEKMQAAYEQLAKMSQAEDKNFDVGSWLTIIRMAKSAKFAMSDDAIMKLAPLISIGEGAGRSGNEFAMLFKTLAFEGKALDNSVGKTNHLNYIEGTGLANDKGGFNPELARDLAKGTPEGIRAFNKLLNDAAKQKGVNPENSLDFKQWLTHVIANTSAQELAMWLHEKPEFIDKQYGLYAQARGNAAATDIDKRDINVALEAASAKFNDASAAFLDPFKKYIIGGLNKLTSAEQWAADHPNRAAIGIAATAAGAIGTYVISNPGQAANTAALGANTFALNKNTGSRGIGESGGKSSSLMSGWRLAALIPAVGTAIDDIITHWNDTQEQKKENEDAFVKALNDRRAYDNDPKNIFDPVQFFKSLWYGDTPFPQSGRRKGIDDGYSMPNQGRRQGIDIDPTKNQGRREGIDLYDGFYHGPMGAYGRGLPTPGNGLIIGNTGQPQAIENRIQSSSLDIDKFINSLQEGATSASESIKNTGSEISGAGSSIVEALHQIAGEIGAVHIPSPGQTVPNVGQMVPGRR